MNRRSKTRNKGRNAVDNRESESSEPSVPSNPKREDGLRQSARRAASSDPTSARLNMEGSPILSPAKRRPISRRKLLANRRNARRSTGPRTGEGKARSRRNAWRHGLRSEALLFGSDGVPTDPELQSVYERVRHQQGQNHPGSDELARSVVVEVSRQRRAMQLEENCWQSALDDSSADISLEYLHRYRTASRRALLKQLSQLRRPEQANPAASPTQKNLNRRRRNFSDLRTEGRGSRDRVLSRRPYVQNQEETED